MRSIFAIEQQSKVEIVHDIGRWMFIGKLAFYHRYSISKEIKNQGAEITIDLMKDLGPQMSYLT